MRMHAATSVLQSLFYIQSALCTETHSVNDFNEDEVGARAASPLLCPVHTKLCMLYLISAQV